MSTRTIRCKLRCSPEATSAFLETKHAFGKACNLVLQEALKAKCKNPIQLHKLTYARIRKESLLSANLAVRAIRRVASSLSQKKKSKRPLPKQFRSASIEYDARIFTFWEEGFRVSLSTVSGRMKAFLEIGEYQKKALKGKKPTCATLIQKGREWWLHIVIEEEDPPLREGDVMGIDLGLRYTAYTSTQFYSSGEQRCAFKAKRAKIRASLQSKATKGSYKKLKQLSGYERRKIRHENHNLSKQLVEEAQRHNVGVIRMEQLSGIRKKTLVWNPHSNRQISGWSFSQLQQFVVYKARRVGISVELVNPAYTSQVCFRCRQKGLRVKDVFTCITCGEKHADFNAACMISIGGAVVNQPELRGCT